jgi:hypothetical protein
VAAVAAAAGHDATDIGRVVDRACGVTLQGSW